MVKKFFKPEIIEISLQDKNGEEKTFKVKPVTKDCMDRLIEIETKYKDKPYKTGVLELCELLGCKEKDLSEYDFQMLSNALKYIWRVIKNPTSKQED